MAITDAIGGTAVEIPNLGKWVVERVMEWSGVCGRFLKWEREHLLMAEATPQVLQDHNEALTWLLRLTRLYYAAVSDPQFPDRSAAREIEGRLLQLEDSWRMFHEALPEEEANKLLAEVFPE